MKKYLFICLAVIAFVGCGPAKRTVKTESNFRSRDSLRIEQIRSDLINSVKTIYDNSRIRIVYYRSERDSVTGEQLIEREELRENNIVAKDSISKMENERIKMVASADSEMAVKEEIRERQGLNWGQKIFMWIGIATMFWGIVYIFKRFKMI